MASDEVIHLADGSDVPRYLVKALDDFEKSWPGATFSLARPAIVAVILKAQEAHK